MKRFALILLTTTLLLPPGTKAYAAKAPDIQVSREGDLLLACSDLSREAAYMRDIVAHAQSIKKDSKVAGAGINVAGAVGSFLIGSMTGGIGVAAAGYLLNEATESKEEEADDIQDLAEQRRSFIMGIYNAKGCEGPFQPLPPDPRLIELAATEPAAGDEEKSGESVHSADSTNHSEQDRYND